MARSTAALLVAATILSATHGATCTSGIIAGALNVKVDGQDVQLFVAQSGGATDAVRVNGSSVSLRYGPRVYMASTCEEKFAPDMFHRIPLLGKTLSYTADLSGMDCACVAALYLVLMPAYNANNEPDPTKCNDYYCDANSVCGIFCPEMDVMEANMHALQVTPHKCDSPQGGHYYPSCDRGGCARNAYKLNSSSIGPGSEYIIDTREPFRVSVSFNGATQLNEIVTVLRQGESTFTLTHGAECGSGYLSALTNAVRDGMTLTLSHWGSSGSSLQWLDVPPCSESDACDEDNSFSVSDITVE